MHITINKRFSAELKKYFWFIRLNDTIKIDNLPENKARESVLKLLLIGTLLIVSLFFVLLLISYFGGDNTHVKHRLYINFFAFLYLTGTYVLYRRMKYTASSLFLLGFYILLSTSSAWHWSINLPFATLLMCVTITLAGILLGARFSLYAAALLGFFLVFLQILTTNRIHTADVSWQKGEQSIPGEVLGYCLLLAILGLISWIFGRQVERSLREARSAKKALLKEKALLATRVKERTEKLREAQLKEMHQLYRFAELGQLSIALLHDLANHLATLNLDIESIESNRTSNAVMRAKESIGYLDELVSKVSRQINDNVEYKKFDYLESINQLSASLKTRLTENNVELHIKSFGMNKNFEIFGDSIRFNQILAILISNAIDASYNENPGKNFVEIDLRTGVSNITIKIKDWGPGIASNDKNKLFNPFFSTKKNGMGLGLFIAQQIVSTHFKGSIKLEKLKNPTVFTVTIPNREKHASAKNNIKDSSVRTKKTP